MWNGDSGFDNHLVRIISVIVGQKYYQQQNETHKEIGIIYYVRLLSLFFMINIKNALGSHFINSQTCLF